MGFVLRQSNYIQVSLYILIIGMRYFSEIEFKFCFKVLVLKILSCPSNIIFPTALAPEVLSHCEKSLYLLKELGTLYKESMLKIL